MPRSPFMLVAACLPSFLALACSASSGDANFNPAETPDGSTDDVSENTGGEGGGAAGTGGIIGPGGGSLVDVIVLPDSEPQETSIVDAAYDVIIDVTGDPSCTDIVPPEALISTGVCTEATNNECDGSHDPPNKQGNVIPNGESGNGFDDDCDGMVDEGCICGGSAIGTTKDCYLLPSSWVDDGSKLPVGWCAQNSKGTVSCVHKGGTSEQPIVEWDGVCRGARPPPTDDVCSTGDFNCDGVDMNSKAASCACATDPVTCPVDPRLMNPFPNAADLTAKDQQNPLINAGIPFIVDGHHWIDDAVEAQATGWVWEITGGDCDNILPHPTFAIYNGSNANNAIRIGQPKIDLGPNLNQHGFLTLPNDEWHQIYPAFSLSGDYVITGRFMLQEKQYECSLKVQVRAPGIRAELCWDTVGNNGSNDVDLHFARLQRNDTCNTHGWFYACGTAPNADDCFWESSSGCPGLSGNPGWGYANSHDGACHGWGSLRDEPGMPFPSKCTNPRLDRDNIFCAPAQTDPNASPMATGEFCGPENINLDNPLPEDRFLVGAQCYGCVNQDHPATHPHINLYCNGNRVLSAGYDPTQPPPHFPALVENGGGVNGSIWTAAMVKWTGDPTNPCEVYPVSSKVPNPDTDGSTGVCVENGPQNLGGTDDWLFTPSGGYPDTEAQACWH